jgi:hypothetical protein
VSPLEAAYSPRMNNTPTWVPIVSALTAIVAIVAGAFTTWFTLRSANARFKLELENNREQNRRSSLIDHRVKVYATLTHHCYKALCQASWIRDKELSDITADQALQLVDPIMEELDVIQILNFESVLLTGGAIFSNVLHFTDDLIVLNSLLTDHSVKTLDGIENSVDLKPLRLRLEDRYINLVVEMRAELGVTEIGPELIRTKATSTDELIDEYKASIHSSA